MHTRLMALGIFVFLPAWAENWPQWRGAMSNGVSAERGLPSQWGAEQNVAWKTAIDGRGHSSPVVWGDRVFLTTAVEGAALPDRKPPVHKMEGEVFRHPDSVGVDHSWRLDVLALDASSGKLLWRRTAYEGPVYDERHKKNTYATPTPVVDGKRVVVSFESQGIYAFDFDGKPLWKASVGNIGTIGMGPGSSPALHQDRVYFVFDQEEGQGSFLLALGAKDGRELWRVKREGEPASWATPVVLGTGSKRMLVVSGTKNVIAYDPANGKELWRAKGVEGNSVPSPASGLDMIFPSAGYPTKRAYGLRMDGTQVWTYEKGTAYVPSPILYGDHLYLLTDRGLITCLEARTGKLIYEGKRVPKPAMFSASPIAFDGKLFVSSEDGDTYVIQAGPVFEVLGTNTLPEPIYATPAVANGSLLIRTNQHLYCIRAKS